MSNGAERYRSVTAILLCLLVLACHREDARKSFVRSLRCGMTRDEVIRLARDTGYKKLAAKREGANDPTFLDLTFHEGRLVSIREAIRVPPSKRIAYRTIDLCVTR